MTHPCHGAGQQAGGDRHGRRLAVRLSMPDAALEALEAEAADLRELLDRGDLTPAEVAFLADMAAADCAAAADVEPDTDG